MAKTAAVFMFDNHIECVFKLEQICGNVTNIRVHSALLSLDKGRQNLAGIMLKSESF